MATLKWLHFPFWKCDNMCLSHQADDIHQKTFTQKKVNPDAVWLLSSHVNTNHWLLSLGPLNHSHRRKLTEGSAGVRRGQGSWGGGVAASAGSVPSMLPAPLIISWFVFNLPDSVLPPAWTLSLPETITATLSLHFISIINYLSHRRERAEEGGGVGGAG